MGVVFVEEIKGTRTYWCVVCGVYYGMVLWCYVVLCVVYNGFIIFYCYVWSVSSLIDFMILQ